jgi:uncharacterized protein
MFKKIGYTALTLFALLNIIAAFHAYHFTHFAAENVVKTKRPNEQTIGEKLKTVFLGVSNPRPRNTILPEMPYDSVFLENTDGLRIACWDIPADTTQIARGTVALFHGFGGAKSSLLKRAEILHKAGYRCVLTDFSGCGDSDGNTTTIGALEANDVILVYDYLKAKHYEPITLLGNSMGAAAIMRAIHTKPDIIQPKSVVLECPFATMQGAVSTRFQNMHIPAFPMAHLLLFWGGVENGFWGFSHKPVVFAEAINCPTLLLYGATDETVLPMDRQSIFDALPNKNKEFTSFPNTRHHELFEKNQTAWASDVLRFLQEF